MVTKPADVESEVSKEKLMQDLRVVVFWDGHRRAVLGGACAMFFALGTLMAVLLRSKVQAKSKLFSASLAELAKDREQLKPREKLGPRMKKCLS